MRCAAPAEEPVAKEAQFAQYVTIQRELDAQRLALNELFLILLDEGVERGAWVDRDREIAREAYAAALKPIDPYSTSLNEVARREKATQAPDRRANPPVVPMRSTSSLEAWYLTRQYHLDLLFDRVTAAQAAAAVADAEEIWLQAAKASDLAPAIPPLLQVRDRGVPWPSSEVNRRVFVAKALTYPGPWELALRCLEAFDAWSILASADGLLPPDPESASENTFIEWQRNWLTLRGINHTFLERPQIDDRYHQTLDRRMIAKRKARREVIDLILKDAALPELNQAVATLATYYAPQPEEPQPAPKPLNRDAVKDYRDLLQRSGDFALEIPSDSDLGRDLRNFAAYLAWRKAVEEQSVDASKLQAELAKDFNSFPAEIVTHLRQQLSDADGKVVPVTGRAVDVLIAQVQTMKALASTEPSAALMDHLIRAIQTGEGIEEKQTTTTEAWQFLAGTGLGTSALEMREKIARTRLQELRIPGVKTNEDLPLLTVYRQALENAVEADQLTAVEAILGQSRLFAILPPAESNQWSAFLTALRAPPGDRPARRSGLRSILSQSSSPGLMRLAAIKLTQAN
jgi:hypothetical protein